MRYPLINSSFLDGLPEIITEKGGDPKILYEEANLSLKSVNGTETLVPFDRQNKLLDLAALQLNCPHLSLELANRQTLAIYGPLANMATASKNLGEALEIFVAHIQIRVQMVNLALVIHQDTAEISIDCAFAQIANSVQFQNHAVALLYNLATILHGKNLALRGVFFKHSEPVNITAYSNHFSCPIAFGSKKLGLSFNRDILSQDIAESAKAIPLHLREYLEIRHENNFIDLVKYCIAFMLASDDCHVEVVAKSIGYSKRTLQRRLDNLGTSFTELVDVVRNQQTEQYICNPFYRLSDIAALLGYSEQSVFTRSFKRWYGINPQEWRKQRLHSEES